LKKQMKPRIRKGIFHRPCHLASEPCVTAWKLERHGGNRSLF
jgi:hypothetical protein